MKFLLSLLLVCEAQAGIKIESVAHLMNGGQGGKEQKMTLVSYYEKDACRVEVPDPMNPTGARGIIFNGKTNSMIVLDPIHKTYFELTETQLGAMKNLQSQMMSSMKEQLKALPPEQRKQVEKMLAEGQKPKEEQKLPSVDYKKIGTGKVGRWTCDRYEGKVEGKKTTEFCSVPMKTLGASASDFKILQKMSSAFSDMSGGKSDAARWDNYLHLGFPVEIYTYGKSGETLMRTEVTQFAQVKIDPALFAAPKDFKKQDGMESLSQKK